MTKPKISIIVPVYNVEKYIGKCLESLINQTFRDIEIICVDDASTDNSVAIIRDFIKKDKRIKLILKKSNSGQSDSRNIGLKKSVAPYVMFCDSDDFYLPTMCDKMYGIITQSGVDIGICGINIIYEVQEAKSILIGDMEYYRIKYIGIQSVTNDLINNCDVSPCNKIFKRSIIDNHDLYFPVGLKYEDAYWFLCYMLWVKRAFFIDEKLYNYVRRDNSTMNQTFRKNSELAIDHLKIAFAIFDYMNEHNKYKENSVYYWTSIFVPYFNFARRYSDSCCKNKLYKMVHDFVKRNYDTENVDWYTSRIINMIANNVFKTKKKYMFGLVSVVETLDTKEIRIIGIPIYKIKFFQKYVKYYLFGIQHKIKHV